MTSRFDDKYQPIHFAGDEWRVINTGATDESGRIYCHLSSLTRFRKQRNGDIPVQMADWLDPALLHPAGRQTALPGTAPDVAGMLQQKARAPIKPPAPQKACDVGLFSDQAQQIDLEDYLR